MKEETEPKSYWTQKEIEHIISDANRNSREQTISKVLKSIADIIENDDKAGSSEYDEGWIQGMLTFRNRAIKRIKKLKEVKR